MHTIIIKNIPDESFTQLGEKYNFPEVIEIDCEKILNEPMISNNLCNHFGKSVGTLAHLFNYLKKINS